MTSAAAEFNVGKSTVHDIVKNQAKLQTFLTEIQDFTYPNISLIRTPSVPTCSDK